MVAQHIKPPFPWFGGKQQMTPMLLSLLPSHQVYVEVFGGAASLLFAKPPAQLDVYNDLDSGLINFFRVLRDPDQAQELIRLLQFTPYAREEWLDCRDHTTVGDVVEQARRFFVLIYQSFSCNISSNSWRHSASTAGGNNPPRAFNNAIDHLHACVERLKRVQVEHDDFTRLIEAYDGDDVLFYADPPYAPDTRRRGGYRVEMTTNDHKRLLEALTTCKGMVILSGYDSPLYHRALHGWQKLQHMTVAHAAGSTRMTKLQGQGAKTNQKRIECIWLKPNTIRQATLFEGI